MSGVLWQKKETHIDEVVQRFLAGDDIVWDRELFLYDILATAAHTSGLMRIGVVSMEECALLTHALKDLANEFRNGTFVLTSKFEDGHSAIEYYLTERHGDVGRKVHTGRSRNDQVLVAMRLFERDALERHVMTCRDIARVCLVRAREEEHTPIPGYTHLQRAVPSTLGLWLGAFAEAFLDNAELASTTSAFINRSPLGSAAGYGVNLPLDRRGVAKDLGFRGIIENAMYCQNSRGKFELLVLEVFAQAMLDVRRLAWDLSIWTTQEVAFMRVADAHSTGSSIMPNKRNPDLVELLRAAYGEVAGARASVEATLSLPSGYHRDLQNTKGPVLKAIGTSLQALSLVAPLVKGLTFDRQRMRDAIDGPMFATDRAVELAATGVPFRAAYAQVAEEASSLAKKPPEESIRARVSPGGSGHLSLEALEARLDHGTSA
ncbi:MAG: argininosuccinate lyase [Polyangiaceae bacterium]